MKKWISLTLAIIIAGLFMWSCSDEESTTDADSTLPVSSITYPANNAEFNEGTQVMIKADATDNKAVEKVEFYIDGDLAGSDTVSPYEYIYNTTGKVGTHTIMAKAYDTSSNVGSSGVVTVIINSTSDSVAPTTIITYPANNAEFSEGATVTIKADATDNVSVSKVEFYIDGSLVNTDTSSPYEYSWATTGKVGSHTVLAKAYDPSNNAGTSILINIVVKSVVSQTGLKVISNPSGAKIYAWGPDGWVDSTKVTPFTFEGIKVGDYRVRLLKNGYYPWWGCKDGWNTPIAVVVAESLTELSAELVAKYSTGTNVALQSNGAVATANGYGSYAGYTAYPAGGNDGILGPYTGPYDDWVGTFWGHYPDGSWLRIELPNIETINAIALVFCYSDYTFNVTGSLDGVTWFDLIPSRHCDFTSYVQTLSEPKNVKYVKFNGTTSGAPSSYIWRYMISEFQLWKN